MRKILSIALAAAVLVVLFASAQGTAALWRAERQLNPGAVTTGSLALAVGNGVAAAQDFAFTGLDTSSLIPGGFVQSPLIVSNTGTVTLGYTLMGAVSGTPTPDGADQALATAVRLTVFVVPEPSICTPAAAITGTPLYAGPLDSGASFPQRRTLAAQGAGAATETLCVRLALPANAPPTAAGGHMALVLSWRGEQQ